MTMSLVINLVLCCGRTFLWSLSEQVLVLSALAGSARHTGEGAFDARGLLGGLPREVVDPQLLQPGLRGAQGAGRGRGCTGDGGGMKTLV